MTGVVHMSSMEPLRIITSTDEMASLPIDTILCPVKIPSLAHRKAWSDLYVAFESTKELNVYEAWNILTMHCPAEQPEVWVLWDPAERGPVQPRQNAYITVIPSRSPRRKAHFRLGYAKSAITHRMPGGVAAIDMSILELDPISGQYVEFLSIAKGTHKSQLPW